MDMHTLHIEHVVLLGLITFLTLVNSWMHRGTRGINWFPVYNFSAFLGALLIALRGHISDPVSIVFGDFLFPLAYLFLHLCLTEFLGARFAFWKPQIALTVLTFIGLLEYGAIHPNTKYRLILYSITLASQIAILAWITFRNISGSLLVSGSLMGLVLALLSLSNVVRLFGIFAWGAPANYLRGGPYLTWTVLNNTVLQGGVAVAFVWMTAAFLHQDLQLQASTDPLTGLLNRRAIEIAADRAIAESRYSHQPLTAILIDLDGFKKINDSLGHQAGDATLIAVAYRLQQGLRKHDLLARLGGDEFVILLPGTSLKTATEMAERLRASIQELEVLYGQQPVSVNASFGLAQVESPSTDWDDLMMGCDKALYAVKSAGGNLVFAE
jgi:diguanylate cyclase (GGDEF)-like protein